MSVQRFQSGGQARREGVHELAGFALIDALRGRRSRRFGRGMQIPDGPLAHASAHEPEPLDAVERSILVLAATGITGWSSGMEHTTSGERDLGCSYPVRLNGRASATAAGIGASEVLVTDDDGTFLTQFRDLLGTDAIPWQDLAPEQLPDALAACSHRISDRRLEVPREPPFLAPHNVWNANVAGSTLLVPLVDLTQQLLDILFIYLGAGFTPWDTVADCACGELGAAIRAGLLDPQRRFSIQEFEQYVLATGAMELALIANNAVLTMQAMGLGGWMFTGIDPPSLLGAYADRGMPGAGFAFITPQAGTSPVCVGLAGAFEAFVPPWHRDMEAAVDAFIERKFGAGGTYDPELPGPWRDLQVKARAERHPLVLVDAVIATASYLYASYGRFPATAPSVYARAYAQAHHVEEDFYDRFYGPGFLLDTHRRHHERWHAG